MVANVVTLHEFCIQSREWDACLFDGIHFQKGSITMTYMVSVHIVSYVIHYVILFLMDFNVASH